LIIAVLGRAFDDMNLLTALHRFEDNDPMRGNPPNMEDFTRSHSLTYAINHCGLDAILNVFG